MATNTTHSKKSDIPDFAPGYQNTAQEYFERGARPTIERNRWFFISILLACSLITSGVGYSILLPLKTVETIQITQVPGGRLVADAAPVGSWAPDADAIAFFLNKWANSVYDINQSTIEQTIAESQEIAISNATRQLQELRRKNNPLALLRENPGLIRSYQYISINFIKDDVALLRFKTITRNKDKVDVITYAMTITFVRVKPKTREQVIRNPAGLFITNFNVNEESKN